MKKMVILTGAGISAESGIPTFRGADGLWEGFKVEEVATPEAWKKNPYKVIDFYNQRRRAIVCAKPNKAHLTAVDLANEYEVTIITQNIDDLHERAGSDRVIHLHGEIMKKRSQVDRDLCVLIEEVNGVFDMSMNDLCPHGLPWRPHVVWFGEEVPAMDAALEEVMQADIFIVVGTSLLVYPAASLVQFIPKGVPVFLIDPASENMKISVDVVKIAANATKGMDLLKLKLKSAAI